jgi:predicted lipoprotein with Yx(FWY)xxD motif
VKRVPALGVVLLAIVVGAAACGGGGASVSSGATRTKKHVQPAATAAPSATVMTADTPLGKILVDANGRAVYAFDHDTAMASGCTDACATLWPALLVSGTPHAGPGVDVAKLGVLAVPAGSAVTYAGHLLHTFANDHAPGDVTGQGFAGLWWVVGSDGQKITTPAPTAATTVPPTPQPAQPAPPETAAPETAPPATSPPTPQPTNPPKTAPPATTPPATTPPSGGGVAF